MALMRRWRLLCCRVRYPHARFGNACDIRSRFGLRQGPNASVVFGERCVLDNDLTIEVGGRLEVGARTIFGHHCTLAARDSLIIGADCLLAEMVSIRDHDHRFDSLEIPIREQGAVSAPVVIGNNVWLGGKVTVLKGVKIGDNAIVGANAVVTKDIPENAICVGVPARVIRLRASSE
ncbi:MAG: acyltransferase [Armatimonadetes bacterium]|nr:acyltransferase [Armatimonadota bacterium]